ncbi:MAG: 50S ribosomal protein L23 [candidate division Zixibacteria bacterium]|nr:50S ribosomal protein L23 [candidate division Zixibacteria bacterium]
MRDPKKIVRMALTTEKSTNLRTEQNKYVFMVDNKANKIEIKKAVEQLFKVKVKRVRTMNVRGKVKRVGRFEGKRPDWKKAIVELQAGETIEQLVQPT